jgi:hypothetical protein
MERLRTQSGWGRLRLGFAIAASAAAAFALATRASWASDHEDAPSLVTDKGADIADVYAFMRPGGTTHLVLVMTVHPGATATTTFDPLVEYQFRVLGYATATGAIDPTVDTRVSCRFEPPGAASAPQVFLCGVNGVSAFGTVGTATTADAGDQIRAWAGLRADPAFGDVAALKQTIANRQLSFRDAGTNAFAGKNALGIVVEVDIDKILLANVDVSGGRPMLAVSATTERL